jgi:hypothetical protein
MGWVVSMLVVWILFVPAGLSAATVLVLGAAGLCAVIFGGAMVRDGEAPRSVVDILSELETGQPRSAGRKG